METWDAALRAWTDYQRAVGTPSTTLDLRLHHLRCVAREVSALPARVSFDDLVAFFASKTSWSANTRRSYRTSLRSFYSWMRATGRIAGESPAHLLPPVRIPRAKPRPTPEQGNETAFVTTIETFRTSEDYPWMDEDSLTYAEGDELLVLMGYEVCERIEALDQPITMESFEADADAYAEEQGIWGPEAVSLYLAAEHLCPNAHEALPES